MDWKEQQRSQRFHVSLYGRVAIPQALLQLFRHKQINDYLKEKNVDSTLQTDAIRGMTPLHMFAMNPNAPADSIAALSEFGTEAAFLLIIIRRHRWRTEERQMLVDWLALFLVFAFTKTHLDNTRKSERCT